MPGPWEDAARGRTRKHAVHGARSSTCPHAHTLKHAVHMRARAPMRAHTHLPAACALCGLGLPLARRLRRHELGKHVGAGAQLELVLVVVLDDARGRVLLLVAAQREPTAQRAPPLLHLHEADRALGPPLGALAAREAERPLLAVEDPREHAPALGRPRRFHAALGAVRAAAAAATALRRRPSRAARRRPLPPEHRRQRPPRLEADAHLQARGNRASIKGHAAIKSQSRCNRGRPP